jgi:hypothetical protein
LSLKEGVIEKRATSSLDNSENNVQIDSQEDVPIAISVRSRCLRHSVITSKDVQALAIKKFKGSKKGITFNDLIAQFSISKRSAQRKLKDCRKYGLLFSPEKHKPQEFYPTCFRAEVIEYLYKKENVPVDPTGVTSHHNPLEQQKAQNLLDILLLLPFAPPHIHKILLMLHIDREFYTTLEKKPRDVNLAKVYEEMIGKAFVTYTYNKNGRVEIAVACSKNPFKLETDDDVIILFSFLGQVKDRMLYHLDDQRGRGVPSESRWVLKGCDLNRDVEISDKMQITLPDIQLKYAGRVFRLYVKALGEKAVCRGEESPTLNLTLDNAFNKIRNPYGPLKEELVARIKDMMADRTDLKTAAASGYRLYHPTWPENN